MCHHPTIVAAHCEAPTFVFFAEQRPNTKFWGKSIELTSEGTLHVLLPQHGDHFCWQKVTTCMRNIFSDARSLEHYGVMTVRNLTTGDSCVLTFKVPRLRAPRRDAGGGSPRACARRSPADVVGLVGCVRALFAGVGLFHVQQERRQRRGLRPPVGWRAAGADV